MGAISLPLGPYCSESELNYYPDQASSPSQRIPIIDITRGVAVLGIAIMNIPEMAYPEDLVLDFYATDPGKGLDYWTGILQEIFFAGKMRGLFTLLFGVSSVLILQKLEHSRPAGPHVSGAYFRRLAWLLVFGLLNAYVFLWWGDVLVKYAVLGIALFYFRKASFAVLAVAMLFCLGMLTLQPLAEYREMSDLRDDYLRVQSEHASGGALGPGDPGIVDEWQQSRADMLPEQAYIEEEIETKTGPYPDIFLDNTSRALEEQTVIFYREDVWDMGLYMLLGIALLRAGFFTGGVNRRLLLAIAAIGIGTGLLVHTWMTLGLYRNFLDPVESRYFLIFEEPGRLPLVLGYVSLILLVFGTPHLRRCGDWMAATGRLALSNYLLQSLLGAFIFYGFGLALFNQLSRMVLVELEYLDKLTNSGPIGLPTLQFSQQLFVDRRPV